MGKCPMVNESCGWLDNHAANMAALWGQGTTSISKGCLSLLLGNLFIPVDYFTMMYFSSHYDDPIQITFCQILRQSYYSLRKKIDLMHRTLVSFVTIFTNSNN
mmetsp:Transcript_29030/g.29407  ORF Transcript_29030/g.29407 Transcript_29030/m.29407 type:complete len:103 (+) Transcript_29030:982-1290(+)